MHKQYDELKNKEWLEQKYVQDKTSAGEIAKLLDCPASTVFRALKRHEISIKQTTKPSEERNCRGCQKAFVVGGRQNKSRDQIWCSNHCRMLHHNPSPNGHSSNAPRPRKNKETVHNEQWLRKKYLEEKLSTTDIAVICNCSAQSVWRMLKKFNIPIRSISEVKKGIHLTGRHNADSTSSVSRQRKRDHEREQALKLEMINAYGGKCACCGETKIAFLSLDHINGGGCEDRKAAGGRDALVRNLKAAGWPQDGLRILCMNCNIATKLGRICPHQFPKEQNITLHLSSEELMNCEQGRVPKSIVNKIQEALLTNTPITTECKTLSQP